MSPAKPSSPLSSLLSRMGTRVPPAQRTTFMILAVVGIVLFIGMRGIFTPWQNKRRLLTEQLSQEKEKLNLLFSIQAQMEQLKKEEENILLPNGGTPTLTSEATRLASQTGLEIESVVPQPEIAFGPYTRSQIEITATAGFSSLLPFLHAIEKHTPLLKIDSLTIVSTSLQEKTSRMSYPLKEEAPGITQRDRQKVTVSISAYSRGSKSSL